jgi:3-methyladenine DNA glycosylase AlkC
MTDQMKFKDYYDENLAASLGKQIRAVHPDFDTPAFVDFVEQRVSPLELKARVAVIAEGLRAHLPSEYPTALDILLGILGDELTEEEGMFDAGYHLMPVAYFVEVYGLEHPDRSIPALYEITKRFTAEFAIRPYLQRYPEQTLSTLREWATDPNPHARRLVSEGTRTRLPWATQLPQFITDPTPVLELLTLLRDDDSAYVRKSVANNLNDLSKDHPQLVRDTLREWLQAPTDERQWIAKHALRTLIKQGDRDALELLGYSSPKLNQCTFTITPETIQLGDALTLMIELESATNDPQPMIVDYIIHFVRAGGKTNSKVFKLKTTTLKPNKALHIEKTHALKPVTVRRYYPGEHKVELQINGECVATSSFWLEVESPN